VRARHNFPLMDSMRGIAVVAVVATHTTFFVSLAGRPATQVRFGYISVTVFFILSGFLLYLPFVHARLTGTQPPSVGAFAWRRFLRIIPGYWVALTIIAVALGLDYVFTPGGVLTFYGVGQVYRHGWELKGLAQAWTLSVEIVLYAMLPLFAWLMRRRRGGSREQILRQELIACGSLVLLSIVYKAAITATGVFTGRYGATFHLSAPTFLDDFAIGMLCATLAAGYRGRPEQPRALRVVDRYPSIPWGVMLVALGIGTAVFGLLGQVGDDTVTGWEYMLRHALIEVIALGLLLPAMFGDPDRGFIRKLLRSRLLLFTGTISFGIYLWHLAILQQLERWNLQSAIGWDTGPWFLVTLAASILVAIASYYLIERPFLNLKRLVKDRPAARPAERIPEQTATTAP
jgi:peptidoglycan/LPS O-acetylase OafA/YrhL